MWFDTKKLGTFVLLFQLPCATWAQTYEPVLHLNVTTTTNGTRTFAYEEQGPALSTSQPAPGFQSLSATGIAFVSGSGSASESVSASHVLPSAFGSASYLLSTPTFTSLAWAHASESASSAGSMVTPTPAVSTGTSFLGVTFEVKSSSTGNATLGKTLPANVKFRQRKKWSAPAASVCSSPEFDLTVENWHESGANMFLASWVRDFAGDPVYARRGVLGAMAQSFLGRAEFLCQIGRSHSCQVTCNEIVSLVPNMQEARALYFIFTAARHYLEIMEIADRALLAAQINIGQWADTMSLQFFWNQETNHDKMFKLTITLLQSFVVFTMFTVMPFIPFDTFEKAVQVEVEELDKPKSGAPVDDLVTSVDKQQELNLKMENAKAASKWLQFGYNFLGNGIPILGIPAQEFMTWEGYERPQIMNAAELCMAISELISTTRYKNMDSVNEAFSGKLYDSNGVTVLGRILAAGSFLATDAQMMKLWSGPQVEKKLTDAVKYRIMSEALKSQGVFIQCTKNINSFICENDDSGPQNLKACVDGRVCYMYKWSGRGYFWRHHVEEPFGVDQLGDWPFVMTPEEIILSSVRTQEEVKKGKSFGRIITNDEAISPQNFMDATTPGAFFLPVCVNDDFSQNTQLDDHTIWDDFNPWSKKHTLPCMCGTFWGDETEQVWKDTGLVNAKHFDKYRSGYCMRQLDRQIPKENRLERFVIDCRLNVHRQGMLNMYGIGQHPFCQPVIDIVNKHGKSYTDMDPYLRTALECKAGLLTKGPKNKPRKECTMFMKHGFEELTSKGNPKVQEWGLQS